MAYKPTLRIKVSTNTDFGKLADSIPEIIKKTMAKTISSSVEASKAAIDDGLFPPLKDITKKIRKLGTTTRAPVSGSKPLYATGELYNSIQATEKGMTFKEYGQYPLEGFTPAKKPRIVRLSGEQKEKVFFINNKGGKVRVPVRYFLTTGEVKTEDIYKEIEEALGK